MLDKKYTCSKKDLLYSNYLEANMTIEEALKNETETAPLPPPEPLSRGWHRCVDYDHS